MIERKKRLEKMLKAEKEESCMARLRQVNTIRKYINDRTGCPSKSLKNQSRTIFFFEECTKNKTV